MLNGEAGLGLGWVLPNTVTLSWSSLWMTFDTMAPGWIETAEVA